MAIAGIDGCKGGWISVEVGPMGTITGTRFVPDLTAYLTSPDAPTVVAIDIPIGLTDAGPRKCDEQVRRAVGARYRSVFPAPIRPALAAKTREEAAAINMLHQNKSVAAHSFGIYKKVAEVDALLANHPELRSRVFEIHPELCFAAMGSDGGELAPMLHPKSWHQGIRDRIRLADAFFDEGAFDRLRQQAPKAASDDDILDAMAAAWTALRIAAGAAKRIPEPPDIDGCGLHMCMWY